MPAVTLLRTGPVLRAVASDGRVVDERRLAESTQAAAELSEELGAMPEALRHWVEGVSGDGLLATSDPALAAAIPPVRTELLGGSELRRVRERAWSRIPDERRFLMAIARLRLARALASPDEVLLALAREEQRLEQVLLREENAAQSWLVVGSGPLSGYVSDAAALRADLKRHHAAILRRLEDQVHVSLPNLGRLVGSVTAARLAAAAGGKVALGRMGSSRLQLLGAKRRPGPGRGPRFGVLFRAEGMGAVPTRRAGAFARSLAALAVIAARADAFTGRSVAPELVRRRERRAERLRKQGS